MMEQSLRLRPSPSGYGIFLALLLLPFVWVSCFTGQQQNGASGGKPQENSWGEDTVRLSMLVVPHDAAYASVLENLGRADLRNIDRALAIFAGSSADSLSRDSMLLSVNEFITSVMLEYYENKLSGNQKLMEQFANKEARSEAMKLSALLEKHGILLTLREGEFYLEPDPSFLYNHLEKALSTSSRNYLQTKIQLAGSTMDGKNQPVTAPDSLSLQMIAWEKFLINHPAYVLKDEILAMYIDAMTLYLTGTEDQPLFDPVSKVIDPEYKASYQRYLEKYPDRESSKTVKKFYDLLSSKGFKYDESLDLFLTEVNFIPTPKPQ
jgi:hypothetical protein